jgi:hypothetical protein
MPHTISLILLKPERELRGAVSSAVSCGIYAPIDELGIMLKTSGSNTEPIDI